MPAAAGKPRMAFVSCNGFSSAGEIKKVKDKNHLWTHMAALHAKNPYNVLVMGGDQVYADPIWEACPAIKDWVETPFETRKRRRFNSAMAAQVKRFYFNLYRDRWHQPEVEGMLSSAPTVMMWDDHDIFDGWGSYNPETQNCAVYEGIFDIARNHFAVFQQQVDHRAAEDHPSKVTGQEGFTRLMQQLQASPHTIASYRDTQRATVLQTSGSSYRLAAAKRKQAPTADEEGRTR